MIRRSWVTIVPIAAVGAAAAVVHSVVIPLAAGDEPSFIVFAVVVAGGIGLIGSAVGFAVARFVRVDRAVRSVVFVVATFLVTVSVGSIPGLIGGLGRALFVAGASAVVYALIDWRGSAPPDPGIRHPASGG